MLYLIPVWSPYGTQRHFCRLYGVAAMNCNLKKDSLCVTLLDAAHSGAVHLGFDTASNRINGLITASLLDAQRDSVKNKPASLLVALLEKALNGVFHLRVVDR